MMESSQKVNDEIMDSLREIDRLCRVRTYFIIVELEGASHESA